MLLVLKSAIAPLIVSRWFAIAQSRAFPRGDRLSQTLKNSSKQAHGKFF
ncbi:hypothetical protein [Scytonema sp. PCC 10023]